MTYIPPTWHNNYDNSHLQQRQEDGTITPKPEYQAFADEKNRQLEQIKSNDRLVWDSITTSFALRPVTSL